MQARPTTDNPAADDALTADSITLIEWPDEVGDGLPESPGGSDGLFRPLLGAYEQHGYAAGYRRAVSDVLAALLAAGEDYIRHERPASAADLRQVVLAFSDHLEHRLGPAGR